MAQVQDMPDPEYFLGAYTGSAGQGWRTTAFSDAAVPSYSGEHAIWERKPLFCVPAPGQRRPPVELASSASIASSGGEKGFTPDANASSGCKAYAGTTVCPIGFKSENEHMQGLMTINVARSGPGSPRSRTIVKSWRNLRRAF